MVRDHIANQYCPNFSRKVLGNGMIGALMPGGKPAALSRLCPKCTDQDFGEAVSFCS